MRNLFFALCMICLLPKALVLAQCDAGFSEVRVKINADFFPHETSWQISTLAGEILHFQSDTSSKTLCLPAEACLIFTIFDSYGDGICCGHGLGSYQVFYNDLLIKEGGSF